MGSSTKSIPVYSLEIRDSDHEFKFETDLNLCSLDCLGIEEKHEKNTRI